MASAETTREAPVLPRMIEVVVRIVLPGVVPDPLAVRMNVRRVRMPLFVRKRMILFDRVPGALHRSGTVSRRACWGGFVTAALMTTAAWLTLRKNRKTTQQQNCEQSSKVLHIHLRN
jgi:hypothetical protein